jgi:hypothetical protein
MGDFPDWPETRLTTQEADMPRYFAAALTALGLGSAAAASAQRPAQPTNTQSIGTNFLQPDLVAVHERGPAIVEAWTTTNPCTPHSHTYTAHVRVKGRFGATTPTPTAMLYRDGQPFQTWALTIPSGNHEIALGSFSWTKDHPCPGGVTVVGPQTPPPNYRLVVDPGGKLAEMSETNNTVTFYLDPGIPFVRAP